jgi:hypothetical protein
MTLRAVKKAEGPRRRRKKTVRERVRLGGDFSAPLRSGRNDECIASPEAQKKEERKANAFVRRTNTVKKANGLASLRSK